MVIRRGHGAGAHPLDGYGLIGDMRTSALVSSRGVIEWMCFPRFDSPSVFGALLDRRQGGLFSISTTGEDVVAKQYYWHDSNILVTIFTTESGAAELRDYMPVGDPGGTSRVIRRLKVMRGTVSFEMSCLPAFNYARDDHTVERSADGVVFKSESISLELRSNRELAIEGRSATLRAILHEGDVALFEMFDASDPPASLSVDEEKALFWKIVSYWQSWLKPCTYKGRWREAVHRSALTLKLLTYAPAGSMVAAPTTSLPEDVGGERNWDYRFTWIRDSAFAIRALAGIGLVNEGREFLRWIQQRFEEREHSGLAVPPLQIMYTIDGASEIPEFTLDHLAGYGDSRPVRIGNGAAKQLQLDVFGELMEAVSVLHKAGVSVPLELWEHLRRMLNWLADYWREPDEGIWEVRGARHQFTFSRLMSWVAFDRGIQVGKDLGVSGEFDLWHRIRGEISDALMVEGWSESRASFVQYPGALALDASLLLIPILGYLGSDAPRVLQMLDTTMKSRERGGLACNGRVYRYDTAQTDDGLAGDEGTFNVCTFWLVEALAMGARFRPEWLSDSQALFERMLLTANHLGLFPEQSGKQGEPLGNFPQAFTHLGLITAALALDKALDAASVPSQ